MLQKIFLLIILFLNIVSAKAQSLVINEVMSANVSTLADKDGDYPDWIELFNGGADRINLNGFGLSDDESDPFKWKFPELSILPQGFLLIFASGKDIRAIPIHWETVIDWGDAWKYLLPKEEPSSNWRTVDFDDATWQSGPSGFGYGDDDDSTDVGSPDPFQPSPLSIFIRKTISIQNVNDVVGALLHVDYDDGFVAYLNNVEIARANMGYLGTVPAFDESASQSHEAKMYTGRDPEKFIVENIQSILRPGQNVLAIQVHNLQLYSSDLTLIPFFTLEMTTIPPNPRGASRWLEIPKTRKLHTNFKIKAMGETLLLSNAAGDTVDKLETGYIPADNSRGRQPDGGLNRLLFDEPTPGASNTTHGYQDIAPAPEFSQAGGFYDSEFSLVLSTLVPENTIRYTLDGSTPCDTSSEYDFPIEIDSTSVVRARVFGENLLPGKTITNSYFINQHFTLPVVSLATDPANFWDIDIGIYVFGDSADTVNYPYWGSNFWEDWERPIHIEFYEPDGQAGFSIDGGVQIFGSWSRLFPQKSLAIFARGRYGSDGMKHRIFPGKSITNFKAIILRNSGQDWGRTFFRDAMLQYLVKDTDLDIQAYRPAMVFLNGEIFGIHNIREKMNEHYLAANRGIDPDNIDFLERDSMIIKGDAVHYKKLLNYAASHEMSMQSNYEYVATLMDIDNFILYTLTVIYFANPDWPWNNVKCWRPGTPDGKWKWLLFDLDYCFHGGHLGPDANMFNEMRNQDNGTTLLFFKLLENETFKNKFINHFADHINITFDSVRVVQIIEQFKAGIEPDMPLQIARWSHTFEGPWWLGKSIDSMEEWFGHIQVPLNFANHRPAHVRRQLIEEFGLMDGAIGTVELDVSPKDGGRIKINSQIIETYPWHGQYFLEIPIQLTALPFPGYRFAGWHGANPPDSAFIEIAFADSQKISAVFEPDAISDDKVVINEINYKSAPDFDTEDWIEFYNNSSNSIDLSGWIFKDSDDTHAFVFSANSNLDAGEYLVLCRDSVAFRRFFPKVKNCLGDFDFGLSSKGELVRLFDSRGNIVDSLTYDESSLWPEQPNGKGPTLELLDPSADNSEPHNWAASKITGGTPGARNSVVTSTKGNDSQQPVYFRLFQNYPNPFNSRTKIQFNLPRKERVTLKIYTLLGEEIQTLIDRNLPAGSFDAVWDGKDKNGASVSSGLYFYRLLTDSFCNAAKMILLR